MVEFKVQQIENGYTIYSVGKETFYKTKEELIKRIVDMIVD